MRLWQYQQSAEPLVFNTANKLSLTATLMTFAASVSRNDQKLIAATMTIWSAVLIRGRFLAAGFSQWSGSVARRTGVILFAALALFAALVMRGRVLAATMTAFSATLGKQFFQILVSAWGQFAGAVIHSHLAFVSLAAAFSVWAGNVVRQVRKFFSAT